MLHSVSPNLCYKLMKQSKEKIITTQPRRLSQLFQITAVGTVMVIFSKKVK